jgi:hypothetical protein
MFYRVKKAAIQVGIKKFWPTCEMLNHLSFLARCGYSYG